MGKVQVRKIGMRAARGSPHQQWALIELAPETVVDVEGLDSRLAQSFGPDHDRLAIEQCIAGTRIPDLTTHGEQQRRVVDLDGPGAHLSCLVSCLRKPACASAGASRDRSLCRAPCAPARAATGAGKT